MGNSIRNHFTFWLIFTVTVCYGSSLYGEWVIHGKSPTNGACNPPFSIARNLHFRDFP
jgi:hypothetical protein